MKLIPKILKRKKLPPGPKVYHFPRPVRVLFAQEEKLFFVPDVINDSEEKHRIYILPELISDDGNKIRISTELMSEITEEYKEMSSIFVRKSLLKQHMLEAILERQDNLSKQVGMLYAQAEKFHGRMRNASANIEAIKEMQILLWAAYANPRESLKKVLPVYPPAKVLIKMAREEAQEKANAGKSASQDVHADDSHLTAEDKRKIELEKKRLELEAQEDEQDRPHLGALVDLKNKMKNAQSGAQQPPKPEGTEAQAIVPEAIPATDKTGEPAPEATLVAPPAAQQESIEDKLKNIQGIDVFGEEVKEIDNDFYIIQEDGKAEKLIPDTPNHIAAKAIYDSLPAVAAKLLDELVFNLIDNAPEGIESFIFENDGRIYDVNAKQRTYHEIKKDHEEYNKLVSKTAFEHGDRGLEIPEPQESEIKDIPPKASTELPEFEVVSAKKVQKVLKKPEEKKGFEFIKDDGMYVHGILYINGVQKNIAYRMGAAGILFNDKYKPILANDVGGKENYNRMRCHCLPQHEKERRAKSMLGHVEHVRTYSVDGGE